MPYIHDVIENLRAHDAKLQRSIDELRLTVHMVEKYLSQISDYPAPGKVSRETSKE